MKTMTIRNIPDDVAAALAANARATNRSMNAAAVAALADAFLPASPKPKRDLSEFIGILTPEEADAIEREIEESCERIDPEDWPGLDVSAFSQWPAAVSEPAP